MTFVSKNKKTTLLRRLKFAFKEQCKLAKIYFILLRARVNWLLRLAAVF